MKTEKSKANHLPDRNQHNPRHRLPSYVVPRLTKVSVTLDPEKSREFRGHVIHDVELKRARKSIELHSDGLNVTQARAKTSRGDLKGRIDLNSLNQRIFLTFDESLPAGPVELKMAFKGKLRKDLRGLYLAKADNKRFAFTQLEAADARKFFPCFDEPSMKIRFTLEVTTSEKHTVISNSAVENTIRRKGGKKTIRFKETPPLSTYLIALAVGDLYSSESTYFGKTEIKVWHAKGKGNLCDFALEAAKETLALLEDYFAISYPYEKLDLVAVPDFEAGAMENAGAVFFRETLLLLDPSTSSIDEKKRVAEVICHELAHMWYGNLVTMSWWDDLWLNEAFATWMAFKIVDRWKPEWRMWHDFQHYRSAALITDALRTSHPIYTKVKTPEEATENFDVITYEKGASVVRMLEVYLTPLIFREGVRTYIQRHREGNAVASDLWKALSECCGFEVEPIIQRWISTTGFPLLRVKRKVKSNRTELHFTQERFLQTSRKTSNIRSEIWTIPWVGRVGKSKLIRKLITARTGLLRIKGAPPSFIYGNANESGFFRVLHDSDELTRLTRNFDLLPSMERQGLLDHQWAAVRANHAPIESYLDLAITREKELDPDVLATLVGPLGFIKDRLILENRQKDKFSEQIGICFAKPLRKLELTRKFKRNLTNLRRASLLKLAAGVGEDKDSILQATQLCEEYMNGHDLIDPNLTDSVINLAARNGSHDLYQSFWKRAGITKNPQNRRKMLIGLTSFRDSSLTQKTLKALLGKKIDTQDVAILLARLLQNPHAREDTWEFMKTHWAQLNKRMPTMLITRPIDALPHLGHPKYKKEVKAFFRDNPVPSGQRALKQTLERFEIDEKLANISQSRIVRWLDRV